MNIEKHLLESIIKEIICYEVKETGRPFEVLMNEFYSSATFSKLSDYKTGLYRESPWYVYDIYLTEKANGKILQTEY